MIALLSLLLLGTGCERGHAPEGHDAHDEDHHEDEAAPEGHGDRAEEGAEGAEIELSEDLGRLPMLVLDLHGTEIERPLAIVLTGGLVTSTAFTLLALPALYGLAARLLERTDPSNHHHTQETTP